MDEPNALMRWVMFHFAGGDALFVGLLAILAISFVPESPRSAGRWTLLTLLALIWGGLSSPAWPIRMLLLAGTLILLWRIVIHVRGRSSPAVGLMTWSVRLVLAATIVLETSMLRNRIESAPPDRLCVIADSITAGLNDGELTWPRRLSEQTGIDVRDAAQPGATLRSALEQADLLGDDRSPLVLEIGGNDLLSGLPVAEFRRDCEALCRKVCTPGRIVWMCELPLPPFCSRYGSEQRRICRQQGIRLIPKRKLMRLLTTSGATVDSIHLSTQGQESFCRLIMREIGAAANVSPGAYEHCERRRIGRESSEVESPRTE